MEFIMELVLELFLEGSLEISSNKKISKWIRYPLLFFILLFFITVIGLLFFVGIMFWKENKLASIFFISIGIFLLVGTIFKFKNLYTKRK